jgi:signal transduction histidine kinase
MPAAQPDKDASGPLVVLLVVVVMGGLVLTSIVSQRTSAKVGSLSNAIVFTTAPSIERLTALRSVVFETQLILSEYLREGPASAPKRSADLEVSLKALNNGVQGYLDLPLLDGEKPYWREIQESLIHLDEAVRRTRELAALGEASAAQRAFSGRVGPAGRQLVEATFKAIEFHARKSQSFALQMGAARHRANAIANILNIICVMLGTAGLLLVLRQTRRQRALMQAHSRFHELRAAELEKFAGRVAHDIRNPLSSARLAAELVLRRGEGDGQKEQAARILRSLSRAEAITTGLLDFARSGAQPEPGARTDAGEVLRDFVRGMSPEAQRLQIDLSLEPVPPVGVLCSPGVYLSLVGNLVRNAIKYMGDSATRHITVRVSEGSSAVRTEVADTGPGIAAANLPSLFEPYFRASQDRGKEGLGLGLATVKKLAEGHHGSVGVASEPGKGTTFWFMLPRAGSALCSMDAGDLVPQGMPREAHP